MALILALIALAGDWAQLNQSALASLAQGKFSDAERLAKAAVAAGANDFQRASAQMNLGRVYRDWARCEPAVRATEQGVQIFAEGEDRLLTMEAASQLVSVFLECDALARARTLEQRYIDLPLARLHLPPERLAHLIGNAGVIAMLRKRFTEAETLLREAITIARPIDRAVLRGSLAMTLMESKRPAEALVAAQRCLALMEAELGLAHPLAAQALANLSTIHARLGDQRSAEDYHQRAVTLLERHFGLGHPLLASVLWNRAQALRANRHKQEARRLEQRARSILNGARSRPLDHTVGFLELKPGW